MSSAFIPLHLLRFLHIPQPLSSSAAAQSAQSLRENHRDLVRRWNLLSLQLRSRSAVLPRCSRFDVSQLAWSHWRDVYNWTEAETALEGIRRREGGVKEKGGSPAPSITRLESRAAAGDGDDVRSGTWIRSWARAADSFHRTLRNEGTKNIPPSEDGL